MSQDEGSLDPTIKSELEEALALLEAHFEKVPQPGFRLFAGIDILQRALRLADNSANRLPQQYRAISKNVRAFFFHRRADGLPELVLPEHVERKLLALIQRAGALSAES
jgi:hypothetical protein